ncbi:glutaredoxin 2 isoform 1-T2 [Sarcophilus harrisii]
MLNDELFQRSILPRPQPGLRVADGECSLAADSHLRVASSRRHPRSRWLSPPPPNPHGPPGGARMATKPAQPRAGAHARSRTGTAEGEAALAPTAPAPPKPARRNLRVATPEARGEAWVRLGGAVATPVKPVTASPAGLGNRAGLDDAACASSDARENEWCVRGLEKRKMSRFSKREDGEAYKL